MDLKKNSPNYSRNILFTCLLNGTAESAFQNVLCFYCTFADSLQSCLRHVRSTYFLSWHNMLE